MKLYKRNTDSFSRLTKGGFYMTNSEDRMIQSIPDEVWQDLINRRDGLVETADDDKRYDVEDEQQERQDEVDLWESEQG